MAAPKKEGGCCTRCKKQIGCGTKHPCFYYQEKEPGFIIWRLVCRDCL